MSILLSRRTAVIGLLLVLLTAALVVAGLYAHLTDVTALANGATEGS